MAKQKLIGRYKITGELGRGAMGLVYKAEDPALGRTVALKTIALSDDEPERDEYRKRFLLEGKAAGRLTHPHIVTVYDFGEERDIAYLAMELLKGTELRTRMQEGAIPIFEAVDIAAQVAEGLGFAHEHGVVHRDVKPGNIMLVARGQAKIMDFGIARMRASDHKTSTGVVLGTPRYMSPEQVAGSPVDHRSDIFSLGIVLYEMLTRTAPFAGEDSTQTMHKIANAEPVAPSRLNPEVPSLLDFVLARALKKDPVVRYQDAYEMAADLRSCLAEMRGRVRAGGKEENPAKDTTKTMRLESVGGRAVVAPAARAIVSDTRMPLSRQFDSSVAVRRLAAPARKDRARLARVPGPVGVWRRLRSDPGPRLLLISALAAGLLASCVISG
ncbi:MAG TPA: serine/threonine-protein kinase [Burkholderiales bacterium]|nr:serine/threonine-protein kinase [Burkholderiales bacterium]